VNVAAAVAFVMRALKLGGDDATERVKEEFVQTKYWQLQRIYAELGHATWSTADRVLCSALKLEFPAPPRVGSQFEKTNPT
jgi:hypothetical protein